MSWAEFDADSALERDILRRALPLMPIASDKSVSLTVDLTLNRVDARIQVSDSLGPTPTSCVDLLQIRPLLVGAAWKVLDLLIDEVLDLAGSTRPKNGRRSIESKVAFARRWPGPYVPFDAVAWDALMKTYAETKDLRHSLVHRRAYTHADNSLCGVDDSKNPLRPLTAEEQAALGRTAQRAAELVLTRPTDGRLTSALFYELGQLSALHGISVPASTWDHAPREIVVPIDVDPTQPGLYVLDAPSLRLHPSLGGNVHADLVIQPRDRPGQELQGRLEEAPNNVVSIDPDNPPPWLS